MAPSSSPAVVLAVVGGVESLTQSVCGRHVQLIVLQMLGWMISYAYQRLAIQPTRRPLPTDPASMAPINPVDQAPSLFYYSHPVLSRPMVPNI